LSIYQYENKNILGGLHDQIWTKFKEEDPDTLFFQEMECPANCCNGDTENLSERAI